ncbi:V-type ATP synthase subunit E [Fervidibacillus halotolerans]|uniref:V-type ATP synthase subunit E n=1 Tax=Fervidibacillus halotolerans TaxID=2980027 RepID=A0A9E8LXU2_9BACI|nr:V-type ATP synthase subunit E [Fervidibacillus halotolerans]WAA11723.1 V-type ATP synthase subunit E [Fervidibacillus halotolerans]
MANLDNLIQKIITDAKREANRNLEEASRKKEEIIQKKKLKAEEVGEKWIQRAEREGNMEKDRLISNAHIQVRDQLLIVKRDFIDRVFSLAKEKLIRMDNREYVLFLQNHLKDVQLTGKEVLVIPEDKRDVVKDLGLSVIVSDEESVESGFLLRSEQFIMNHSVDFLLEYDRDELELEVAQILFND